MRGNQGSGVGKLFPFRSIPAGAGEPLSTAGLTTASEVYPRGCGGTEGLSLVLSGIGGLSPRVRGNLPALPNSVEISGSIPAGAGEPRRGALSGEHHRVYPRGCGGTPI